MKRLAKVRGRGLVLLLGMAVSSSACISNSGGDEEEVGNAESEIVMGSANYKLLTELEGLGPDGARALYGRAVGTFPESGCSGFLIEDDVVVSARTCRMAGNNVVTSDTQEFQLGLHGSGAATGNFNPALIEAMVKLMALGVPTSVFITGQISLETLTKWSCNAVQQTPGRDVEYFACEPNNILWTNDNGTTTQLALMPGHLYGHMNVKPSVPGAVTSIRNLGVNKRCGDPQKSTLSSTGQMWEVSEACDEWSPDAFGSCFDYTSDANLGHEGGPIFVNATNEVFGIHTGHWHFWLHDAGDDSDPCASASFNYAENLGTYIANDVFNFTNDSPNGNGSSTGVTLSAGTFVGGTGGTARNLTCPSNYLAAGVIGSTAADGHLGNFGLVCMPNTDFFQGDLTGDVDAYRLDRAVVIAGGSIDTGFTVADRVDFNSYYNEVRSSTAVAPFQQRLNMCPPGEFLKGITGHFSSLAGSVTELTCSPPKFFNMETTRTVNNLGDLSSADSRSFSEQSTECGGAFQFLSGLNLHSGWVTDGFQALCRRAF